LGERALYNNALAEIRFPAGIQSIGALALGNNQTQPENLIIYGTAGTVAETYAATNGHTFWPYGALTITLSVSPEGSGTVHGKGGYVSGTILTVRAFPAEHYAFCGWFEADTLVSAEAEYTFTVEANRLLVARFSPVNYFMSALADPLEGGNVSGGGDYPYGMQVSLTAQPASGYRFRHWQEGISLYTQNPLTYIASGDRSLLAVFRKQILVRRLAGSNRYLTAAALSQEGWPTGAQTVVLTRGDEFADALAGTPLAYYLKAPILLTPSSVLSGAARDEILRLGATTVYILGGESAVSQAVENQLLQMGLIIVRLSGANRYATAARIAQALYDLGLESDTAMLAVGTQFPDALAAAVHAARQGMPILLTRKDTLPGDTQNMFPTLGISSVLVVGGPGAISENVYSQLPAGPGTDRIYGANRYATAVALAQYFSPAAETVWLATGLDFPDAVTGGALAARQGSGMLLVDGTRSQPPQSVVDYLMGQGTEDAVLLGGTTVICEALAAWF
jgi:putative cell wall-binding protein